MRSLTATPDESLYPGTIVRLVDNYDAGPGSGPVDLMIYDPLTDDAGLGLMVVSGYKSGQPLSILPSESKRPGHTSLETSWLLANWNDWFCYTYERDARGNLVPLPVEGTLIVAWDEREIVLKS